MSACVWSPRTLLCGPADAWPRHQRLQGNSALHHAARGGHKGVVTLLVRCGGATPRHAARTCGVPPNAARLPSRCVDPHVPASRSPMHALAHAPCQRTAHPTQPTALRVRRKKANPNTRNFNKSEYASGNWLRWAPACAAGGGACTTVPVGRMEVCEGWASWQAAACPRWRAQLPRRLLACPPPRACPQRRQAAAAAAPDAAARGGGGGGC